MKLVFNTVFLQTMTHESSINGSKKSPKVLNSFRDNNNFGTKIGILGFFLLQIQ